MNALVPLPIEEVVFFNVPAAWQDMPQDWLEGWAFWRLCDSVRMQHSAIPLGPPRDIDWIITTDPADIDQLKLRHPCEGCSEAVKRAGVWMHDNPEQKVVLAQFTLDYLRSPAEAAEYQGGAE